MASRTKTPTEIIDEILEESGYQGVEVVSEEEGKALFDERARFYMKMSGDEFLRRWDAGEWKDDPDQPGVMTMLMFMPFAGRPFPLGEE